MILKDSKCSKMSTIVGSLCVSFSVILSTAIIPGIARYTYCGQVYLKSEKVVKHGTVEIEYIPSNHVTKGTLRSWVHSNDTHSETLKLDNGIYEETPEKNNKYVLSINMFSVSMNGGYGVYCGERLKYTDIISVKLSEPPSGPIINGLQNIENCTGCIVCEDNDRIALACEIHGGSHPLNVTITIGNESFLAQKYRSTTYNVFFLVKDHHHMENVIFSVINDALSSPLSVTAQMFVIKQPTFHFSVPEILRDGEAVTCTSEGGRPNPNVYVSISGSNVSSAHHFYNRTTSSNTNIITLTTFKREWNKENITCCRYNEWYKIAQICSRPKQVNYLFPPSSVMLEVEAVSHSPSQMYANCTVYGSNPACNAQIRAPTGIIGSKRSSRNISLPHSAWNSMSEVYLNVSKEDNGKDVTCVVECGEFSVDLTDTVKILLPPKDDEDDKYNNKQKTAGQASDKSIIWIILGASVLVVVIVIAVLFVVFRKKGQTLEDKREGRVHHHTQEGHTRCAIQTSEDRPAGNLEESEHALDNEGKENRLEGNLKKSGNRLHDDDEVPIYSQPIKKKTTENPDNIYAQVNKTRKTASSPSSANSSTVEKDGQLLYADLAFDPNAAPSKAAVAKQEDSPTEYVDIDYVKTKANKEIDDVPTKQENL